MVDIADCAVGWDMLGGVGKLVCDGKWGEVVRWGGLLKRLKREAVDLPPPPPLTTKNNDLGGGVGGWEL